MAAAAVAAGMASAARVAKADPKAEATGAAKPVPMDASRDVAAKAAPMVARKRAAKVAPRAVDVVRNAKSARPSQRTARALKRGPTCVGKRVLNLAANRVARAAGKAATKAAAARALSANRVRHCRALRLRLMRWPHRSPVLPIRCPAQKQATAAKRKASVKVLVGATAAVVAADETVTRPPKPASTASKRSWKTARQSVPNLMPQQLSPSLARPMLRCLQKAVKAVVAGEAGIATAASAATNHWPTTARQARL